MDYFLIYKTDKSASCDKPIVLTGGYNFVKKISITLYNREMMNYILTKKLNKSLKNIINLYLLCANSEDDETDDEAAREALVPKIDLMRSILLEKYSFFLNKEVIEDYLNKIEKLEKKVGNLQSKKSRSL